MGYISSKNLSLTFVFVSFVLYLCWGLILCIWEVCFYPWKEICNVYLSYDDRVDRPEVTALDRTLKSHDKLTSCKSCDDVIHPIESTEFCWNITGLLSASGSDSTRHLWNISSQLVLYLRNLTKNDVIFMFWWGYYAQLNFSPDPFALPCGLTPEPQYIFHCCFSGRHSVETRRAGNSLSLRG